MINSKLPVNFTCQTTLNKQINFSGISLHKGVISNMKIKPSKANTGIVFRRTDKNYKQNVINAHFLNVSDTLLCTKLTNEHTLSISTVEHLMAALIGFGVDNVIVEVDCPELPILDGSSSQYIRSFKKVGLKKLNENRKVINVLKKVSVFGKDRSISIEPNNGLTIEMEINHDCKLIKSQRFLYKLENSSFEDQLMNARTYGFKEQASMLIKQGLALGASENNALVFDGDNVSNAEGLRYYNEPVRHKILDCIGDIYMAGFRINGKVIAYKSGHELNNKLMHTLFSDNKNWSISPYKSSETFNFENSLEPMTAIA